MKTLISTPETSSKKYKTIRPIGFHPTKPGCSHNGYAMIFGEENTRQESKEHLGLTTVYVSDKTVEQVQNIVSPNQVASYLRGLVGCHRQRIDTIMRRRQSKGSL